MTTQTTKIQINGHDRMAGQHKEYFQIKQPYQHHTSIPGYNIKEKEIPEVLNSPIISPIPTSNNNAYKLQSLNSGALETNTLTNDKFCAVCALGSLTEDVEQITSPNTLLIRDSITQSVTYYPGDIIEIRINVNSATTGISCSQTFAVTNVRIKETETSTGYITELTLNKNILEQALPNGSPLTVTDNDQLIITITARTNNPMSNCSQLKKDINLYSFALDPEEHQPSGTCNFSKVESASLIFSDTTYVSNIYAVNYNVLRVMSGMAGIAYAA